MEPRRAFVPTQRVRVRPPAGPALLEHGCLIAIAGPRLGQCIAVSEIPVVIGRSPDADVQVDHPSVSRLHCAVWQDERHFYVRDLGSKNGTLVNDAVAAHAELAAGDWISIGETTFKFVASDGPEARYHETLYELATIDSLTRLYNRRKFRQHVDEAFAKLGHGEEALAIAIVDLDRFKQVNDRHGHAAGDEALATVAALLRQALDRCDSGGRLGGDEFALLFAGCGIDEARARCERVRRKVEEVRWDFSADNGAVTISIGVAEWTPAMREAAELLRAADEALLAVKAAGRNRVGVAAAPTRA